MADDDALLRMVSCPAGQEDSPLESSLLEELERLIETDHAADVFTTPEASPLCDTSVSEGKSVVKYPWRAT